MCNFVSLRPSGDFTLIAHVPEDLPGYLQAGLMVRKSNLSFDQMVFIGKDDTRVSLYNRSKPRQEISPILLPDDNKTCFRIDREGDELSVYTAPYDDASGCPDLGGAWGDKITVGFDEVIDDWQGTIEVGITAAMQHKFDGPFPPDLVTEIDINNIRFLDKGHQLADVPTIINTAFSEGNLITNWSFENEDYFFGPLDPPTGPGDNEFYQPHFEETETDKAYEGRYFCRIMNKQSPYTLTSQRMPLAFARNGIHSDQLILSFKYRISATNTNAYPVITIYNYDNSSLRIPLNSALNLNNPGIWQDYHTEIDISVYPNAYGFTLELIDAGVTVNGALDFDNIRLYPFYADINNSKISSPPVTTVTFADGLLQKFQVIQRNGDTEDIVAATILDSEGRIIRTLPLYSDKQNLGEVKSDPIAGVNTYFTTPDPSRPYDPSSSDITHKPNIADFREDYGTVTYDNSPANRMVKGLGNLADKSADSEYKYYMDNVDEHGIPMDDVVPHHLVTVTIASATGDPADNRVQEEYVNPYGYVTMNITKDDPTFADDLVSFREPDVLDRTWTSTSPMGHAFDPDLGGYVTTYNYNTLDQVLEANDPDAGTSFSLYDKLGNLRLFKDGNKINTDSLLVNKYDAFSRLIEVYMVDNSGTDRFIQEIADNPSWPDNPVTGKRIVIKNEYDFIPILPSGINPNDMLYLKGKLAASHSYSQLGKVSKYFSYDYRGRIKYTWMDVGTDDMLPLQKQSFTYNQAGQVILKITEGKKPGNNAAGNSNYAKYEKYTYDELNRIKAVWSKKSSDDTYVKVSEFEYWPDGKVRYKNFGDNQTNPDKNSQSIAYAYDQASRLDMQRHEKEDCAEWSSTDKYNQELSYDRQGNISSILYNLPPSVPKYTRGFSYQYDHFNRLIRDDYGASESARLDMGEDKFDATFTYNDDGAIQTLARGPLANEAIALHGLYNYNWGNHQVTSINNFVSNGGKDRSDINNYVYDHNGNVIEDKGLKRKIDYDYRNLPIKITQYTDENLSIEKSSTLFLYDSEGYRVAKFYKEK